MYRQTIVKRAYHDLLPDLFRADKSIGESFFFYFQGNNWPNHALIQLNEFDVAV